MVYNWNKNKPKKDRRPLNQRVQEHVLKYYRDRGYKIVNNWPVETQESRENWARHQEQVQSMKARNKRR